MNTSEQLAQFERRLRFTQFALAISVLALLILLLTRPMPTATAAGPSVIHVRGIVIEDGSGHPRLLLGAPTPAVEGRKRADNVDGIILLGENGADRVVINYHGYEPQVAGSIGKRGTPSSAGFLINDGDGNERAGMGVSDDGSRVTLGMDYSDRDAMGLLVSPAFSGLAIFARDGERNDQVAMGVTKDGTATFKLAETNGDEQVMLEAKKGGLPRVLVMNPATRKLEEVTGRLVSK